MGANACSVSFGGSIPYSVHLVMMACCLVEACLRATVNFLLAHCATDISLVELAFGCLNKGLTD